MNDVLSSVLDAVQSVDPVLRTVLAGVAIMLETAVLVGLIVPGDTVIIVASTAVENPVQYVSLVVVVLVGSLLGESIGFAVGRWFGPRLKASWVGRRIGVRQFERAERYLGRRGGIAVFVSRFIPVLHSLIPMTVGMSTMRYRTFLAWTAPACVSWTLIYVTLGALAANSYRELAEELHWAGFGFVAVVLLFLVIAFVVKKVLARGAERHMTADDEGPDGDAARPLADDTRD